jgi:hypothetical protein
VLSWALWHRGYPDQSARAADRALAYSRQLGHAHTLYHAGVAAVFAWDAPTFYAYGNDCVALASKHGFALWAARGRILQGWAGAQKGEATAGIGRIRDRSAATEATGTPVSTPFYLTLLAEALALAGEIEEGLDALDDALATAAVSGERAGTQKFIACAASSPPDCYIPIRRRPRSRSAPPSRSPASKAHEATHCAPPRASPAPLRFIHRGLRHRRSKRAKALLDELA